MRLAEWKGRLRMSFSNSWGRLDQSSGSCYRVTQDTSSRQDQERKEEGQNRAGVERTIRSSARLSPPRQRPPARGSR